MVQPFNPAFDRLRGLTVGRRPLLLAAAAALVYAGAHFLWYLGTPLGQVPVLDEREILDLAEAIRSGSLPAEPFYRAPGYPLILAGFLAAGLPPGSLFATALALGVLLHGLNAALISRIAGRLFDGNAALIAGILAAFYPVLVHYSTQALDAVPALSLFLLGLDGLLRAAAPLNRAPGGWLQASVAWSAATFLRPNYLFVWLLLPVLAAWQASDVRRRNLAAACSGLFLFALQGWWQHSIGGGFGVLPSQGAYNLWAANQPGTHGRYYVQKFPSPPGSHINPARHDASRLYTTETGAAPENVGAMNTYWRERTFSAIATQPVAWLGLLGRKTYALLNDWEQYNNKTYAFHRDRSPVLRWNPLSWGVIFLLGGAGFVQLRRQSPALAGRFFWVAAAVGASVLLFFVSARFRLPLAAMLLILAGGAWSSVHCAITRSRWNLAGLAVAGLLLGGLVWSNFDDVRDTRTFVQDHALLARAADAVGDDITAWEEARRALALQPGHGPALTVAVTAWFNLLLNETARPTDEIAWREYCRRLLAQPDLGSADVRTIAGLALWRACERPKALAVWQELHPSPSSIAARLLSGEKLPVATAGGGGSPLVRLAGSLGLMPLPSGAIPQAPLDAQRDAQRLFGLTVNVP